MVMAILVAAAVAAAAPAQADVPPVPGLCTAPVPTDPETPGCYQTNEVDLLDPSSALYWHILHRRR